MPGSCLCCHKESRLLNKSALLSVPSAKSLLIGSRNLTISYFNYSGKIKLFHKSGTTLLDQKIHIISMHRSTLKLLYDGLYFSIEREFIQFYSEDMFIIF